MLEKKSWYEIQDGNRYIPAGDCNPIPDVSDLPRSPRRGSRSPVPVPVSDWSHGGPTGATHLTTSQGWLRPHWRHHGEGRRARGSRAVNRCSKVVGELMSIEGARVPQEETSGFRNKPSL